MLVIKISCLVMAVFCIPFCIAKAKELYRLKKRLKVLLELDPFEKTEE